MDKVRKYTKLAISRWEALPDLYRRYVSLYVIAFPIGLISIVFAVLQVPYALVFFVAGVLTLFSTEKPKEDPQHSSVTHFEINARFNTWNYISIGFLVATAILFQFTQINKGVLALLFWSISCTALLKYFPQVNATLSLELIIDYLHQELPHLDAQTVTGFVFAKQNNLPLENLEASADEKQELEKLYATYVQRLSNNNS